jgi:hypothetical protein
MKSIHALCRKNFNTSKKISILNVNLHAEKLSCGLFNFDLDFLKVVISTETIYLFIITQFEMTNAIK